VHELSVAQALVDELEALASQHGAHAVARAVLRVGPLAGVVPELLQTAFPLAAAGSRAEAAELEIEPSPVRVRCRACGAESEASPNRLLCAHCQAWQTELVSGDEMILASVEFLVEEKTS
jgi:hydrogenase nickel incorporation protein HypA/HybF